MRARLPDVEDHVDRAGVRIGYEVFGDGDTTILLLPTWTIVHSRFWKMQVPYLSRYYRVITFDPPGNGRSDPSTDPNRHSALSCARDAIAVLDECDVDDAVVVGLSLGAQFGVVLATEWPQRVAGLVLIAPALPVAPPSPERAKLMESLYEPYPDDVSGWGKYNVSYWHDHYQDFAEFFFAQCFSEPHSTKQIEDAVGWALETGPEILEAESYAKSPDTDWVSIVSRVECPTLVIHGTDDRIHPHERGAETARLTNGSLITMEGSGHIPLARDPVKVNLALRDFARAVMGS